MESHHHLESLALDKRVNIVKQTKVPQQNQLRYDNKVFIVRHEAFVAPHNTGTISLEHMNIANS